MRRQVEEEGDRGSYTYSYSLVSVWGGITLVASIPRVTFVLRCGLTEQWSKKESGKDRELHSFIQFYSVLLGQKKRIED